MTTSSSPPNYDAGPGSGVRRAPHVEAEYRVLREVASRSDLDTVGGHFAACLDRQFAAGDDKLCGLVMLRLFRDVILGDGGARQIWASFAAKLLAQRASLRDSGWDVQSWREASMRAGLELPAVVLAHPSRDEAWMTEHPLAVVLSKPERLTKQVVIELCASSADAPVSVLLLLLPLCTMDRVSQLALRHESLLVRDAACLLLQLRRRVVKFPPSRRQTPRLKAI